MKLVRRHWVDEALDRLRFRLDTWPSMAYQPLPWLGIHTARRAVGVESRWRVIEEALEGRDVRTGLDLGCNAGYFTIQLARRGITTIGVESDPRFVRILRFGAKRLALPDVGCLDVTVSPTTASLLPPADVVLFLSLWHHLVRYHGLDGATDVLREVWARTGHVLFFETGQQEMPARYRLPDMSPDPKVYLEKYLAGQCPGGQVEHLGLHSAFTPEREPCQRNLFAVVRERT
jgi:SAM-dependent methyltransferase